MKEKTQQDYFAIYYGKRATEEGAMKFESCKKFGDLQDARRFVLQYLPGAVAKAGPMMPEDEAFVRSREYPYLVVGETSYALYDMSESAGSGHDYLALRSSAEGLEGAIEKVSKMKDVSRTFVGIELKLG